MDISAKICQAITHRVKGTLGISEEDAEKVNYGLMILVSTIFKLSIILLVAAFLGIFKLVLITFLTFGALRTFAGGVHAKTSLQCLVAMFFFYFTIVYCAIYLPFSFQAKALLSLINLILILLYAPADTAEKPIIGEKHKKNLRFLAVATMVVLFLVSLFQSQTISNIIILATFTECLTITPFAYKITKSKRGDAYEEL